MIEKKKFLSIGRSYGFINRPTNSTNLSINQNFIDKLKNKIFRDKKILFGFISIFLLMILYFLYS